MEKRMTHLAEDGSASMVDVSGKALSRREARARGEIRLASGTVTAIRENQVKKGDVLSVARIAGIQAAKQTANLIPLCHPLPLTKVAVEFEIGDEGVTIEAFAKTTAQTGVEMEALTAVSVAALTIYDMCKAIDATMEIGAINLVEKTKQALEP